MPQYNYLNTPYMNGFYQPQQQQMNNLKGRPVSSLEEVRAAQIDFDGSLFVFPDIANKRIYTKQINVDGTASLNMYELKPIPTQATIETNQFITRAEFEEALAKLRQPTPQTVEEKPKSSPSISF